MESYVTQEVITSNLTGNSENITIALWLSGGMLQVEGDDSIEYHVPEKLEKYPTEVSWYFTSYCKKWNFRKLARFRLFY